MISSHDSFTPFQQSTEGYTKPERFTFPFYYEPHPLSVLAASELQRHLNQAHEWQHDFGVDAHGHLKPQEQTKDAIGKMFGVLVVENAQGQLGYLSAFSGKIADSNQIPNFVPPIFDMLEQDGFFRDEHNAINKVSREFKALEKSPDYQQLLTLHSQQKQLAEQEIENHRALMIENRKNRKLQREQAEHTLDHEQLTQLQIQMSRESVMDKNALKQLKSTWQAKITAIELQLTEFKRQLDDKKQLRRKMSNTLQQKLFDQYQFLNANGVTKSLTAIFEPTPNKVPPAGAGECAAPKLLQYAFKNNLTPIALAEFWWGCAPKSEIRQHKKFYASCMGKCHPILGHMMLGLQVDDNPLLINPAQGKSVDILYQDEDIAVVNKPADFLSVPGKTIQDSVLSRMQEIFPEATGPLIVHRLDMATSGLMVIAISKRANKSLQKQFIGRFVQKRYVALIEGVPEVTSGTIELPLRGDLYDRPRQLVCHTHGKPANTFWQVIETNSETSQTKVYLYPKTGRTHQLRVHCAHPDGLGMPIVGDGLYGQKSKRLHLHAESIEFTHPITNEVIHFQVDADF
ncbi:RNA pseudouridine synthase [Vibrio sp. 10N.286.49.B3]|uniref:RluA family pseudouridine synthase n=1 Tax=Vibrio sp. 10N.286.49.B3 TaxID=1880855 RepID=UPI000C824ACB|nr:pseudouridine synthase [Vibrio sp. 10N.286.49.B3]PMH46595.1 RNA pseudouridine synthase [Vibrio sp. 10N.286.49.B3]